MDIRLRRHLDTARGTISAGAAARLGLGPYDLRALCAAGVLVHVARGAYADGALMAVADAEEAHRLRTTAIVLSRHGSLAASHQSAVVLHRLPVLRAELEPVRTVHTASTGRTKVQNAFTVHRCPGADALGTVHGVPTVIPAVAVLGTAVLAGVRSGVMAADAALHTGLTTVHELEEWVRRLRHVPGVSRARYVVRHADVSAESPGESLLRLVLVELNHIFIAQHVLIRPGGGEARVDFYLPELGVVVEFDGMVKYADSDGASALAAEKMREDDLRSLGHGVARIVWADLFQPLRVERKIQAAARTVRAGRAGRA
jgi:very-short-patch-repair endonuclease